MGLITKEVWVTVGGPSTKYYEELGYKIPKTKDKKNRMVVVKGTKILVKTEDIFKGSSLLVDAECDCCGNKLQQVKYLNIHFYEDKYYCQKCFNNEYEEWMNFKKWCYTYLSKEEADIIMLKWDYILNKMGPSEVGYGSEGINKKGHWFKCLDHPDHGSELHNINDFTNRRKGSLITCRKCNTLRATHPHLVKFLNNDEDADKYSRGSKTSVPMHCPDCGYEKDFLICTLVNQKFTCPRCSDRVSYNEKFIISLFEQLSLNFKPQLSKTTFEWCSSYRYDNYIYDIDCVVEAMGIQHYEEIKGWNSLKEVQENDKIKENLAKDNHIKNYIILYCRKSEDLKWIKNSIMSRNITRPNQPCLAELLDFKEEDIDWLKAHKDGLKNLVKICCNMWSSGIRNTVKIAGILKSTTSGTVGKYLKQGAELGWCDYDPKEVMANQEYNYKKVICLTTNKVFESLVSAGKEYDIEASSISACCRENCTNITAGKHIETKDKLVWMFYEDYILKTEEEIKNILNNALKTHKFKKQVICLTTNKVFDSGVDASREYNIDESGVIKGCKGIQSFVGKHPITNEKLIWMYYDEYLLKSEEEIKEILNNKQGKIPLHFVKIICLTTGEVFNSQIEASRKYNINNTNISAYLKDKERHKYTGKHPETGEQMTWEYYDKYLQQIAK